MAIIVVVAHVFGSEGGLVMGRFTYMAVSVFFVLSGFVLSHVYRAKVFSNLTGKAYLGFLRNRAARILPLYFATTLVCFGVVVAAARLGRQFTHEVDTSFPNLLYNLFALDVWQRNPGVANTFPFVRWSVTVEIWMYALIFPLCAMSYHWFIRRDTRTYVGIILLFALGVAILEITPETFPLHALFVRGIPYFIAGFLIYCLGPRTIPGGVEKLLWLVVLPILMCFSEMSLAMAALIVFSVANAVPQSFVSRFFGARFSVFLGNISYSIYLWHGIFALGVSTARRTVENYWHSAPGANLICLALLLTASITTAVLSYRYFEIPFQRLIRGDRGVRRVANP